MDSNQYSWPTERSTQKKALGVHEVDALTALSAQVASLSKQIGSLTSNVHASPAVCEFCAGPHASAECQDGNMFALTNSEEAHYVRNYNRPQNNAFSNTYNQGSRNHPNFSWRNNQNTLRPPSGFQSQMQPQ